MGEVILAAGDPVEKFQIVSKGKCKVKIFVFIFSLKNLNS